MTNVEKSPLEKLKEIPGKIKEIIPEKGWRTEETLREFGISKGQLKKEWEKTAKKWQDPEGLPKKEFLEKTAQLALKRGGKEEELADMEKILINGIALNKIGKWQEVLRLAEQMYVRGVWQPAKPSLKYISRQRKELPLSEGRRKFKTPQNGNEKKVLELLLLSSYEKKLIMDNKDKMKTLAVRKAIAQALAPQIWEKGLSKKEKEDFNRNYLAVKEGLEKEKQDYLKPIKDIGIGWLKGRRAKISNLRK